MATHRSEYYRLNGDTWDLHLFRTAANLVDETESRLFVSPAQRTSIDNYLLSKFNIADKLLKLNEDGEIPIGLIPGGLAYLPLAGGTMLDDINMGNKNISNLYRLQGNNDFRIEFGKQDEISFEIGPMPNSYASYRFDLNSFNVGGNKIANLGDPTVGTDAATRQFVEQLVAQGTQIVGSVRAASTGLVSPLSGIKSIDGVNLVAGDRVLLKNQTVAAENGIYTVSATAWTPIPDDSRKGSLTFTLEGSTNKGKQFYNNGTKWEIFFVQDTYYAPNGGGLELDASGFGFRIKDNGIVNKMILDGTVDIAKLANFQGSESLTNWGQMGAAASNYTLSNHMNRIYSAIKILRGTANYNTNNQQTIAGAYAAVQTKNRVVTGSAVPSATTGYNTGDIYLRELSRN